MRFPRSPGSLPVFHPHGKTIRAETGYAEGKAIARFYRSMIAEAIAPDVTRDIAIKRILEALDMFPINSLKTDPAFPWQAPSARPHHRSTGPCSARA